MTVVEFEQVLEGILLSISGPRKSTRRFRFRQGRSLASVGATSCSNLASALSSPSSSSAPPSKNDAVAAKKINTQLDNALVEQWREKSVVDRNRQMAELLEGRRRGKKILGGPSSLLVGFFEFLHSCLYNGGYDVSLGTINRPGQHSLLYF